MSAVGKKKQIEGVEEVVVRRLAAWNEVAHGKGINQGIESLVIMVCRFGLHFVWSGASGDNFPVLFIYAQTTLSGGVNQAFGVDSASQMIMQVAPFGHA
jgi:hypothetical protein